MYKFTYDGTTPVSFTSGGNTYYYITNLQGDVVAITNWQGRTLATYTYDAWGNPLSINSTFIEDLAEINPLRYRGYVYDQECNLYYLQSRYYDPGMGRFINADSYATTGQGLLGHNMFAYCGNEPVRHADPTGHAYYVLGIESGNLTTNSMLCHPGGGGGSSITHVAASRKETAKIIQRENAFFNNTSEQVVLESTSIAFYNGVLVIRADLGDGGAFSFGIIVLDDYYTNNELGINTLKHEYGHAQHMKQIGMVPYLFTTAIPSLIGAGLTNAKILPNDLYYNLPWEHVAEMYGGVSRDTHTDWAKPAAEAFWVYTVVVSIWTGGV